MPVTLEQNEKSSVIRLEGAIDIASAAELKKLLLQAFESGHEVRVALDGATDLDVTAVQLLWAARRQAKVAGGKFALARQAPESINSALRQAGFTDAITAVDDSRVRGVESCQQ